MSKPDNVLLIGATGGTGYRAIQGFLDQGVSNLQVMTRQVDKSRVAIAQLDQLGIKLVEADLDDLALWKQHLLMLATSTATPRRATIHKLIRSKLSG